ncbi:MAG: pentapeptide repeat-containing protein, partial [Candidatus Eremiobacteraeota bacterium]|nr:pentapeptide repeat-containing protein [Candidatus Eremiobacteraeota bacterium]
MILLPQHLLQELSAGELDRISLHELAHLHCGDDWTNSVQRFAQTLFFFNPAIRFVGSQLDLEREVACDDWVLSLTGDVRPYATCLTRMAELTSWPHRPLAAPGVFVTRKGISIRIERLLNKHRNARVNISYGVPGVVVLALVGFFVLANVVTPVIAYTTESASSTVAKVSHTVSHGIALVTHHKQVAPKVVPAVPAVPALAKATPSAPPVPAKPLRKNIIVNKVKSRPELPKQPPHVFGQLAPIAHIPLTPRHARASGDGAAVDIPEINVNVPEQNIAVHVPAIHVHVPGQHITIPQTIGANNGGFSCTGCSFKGVNWAGKDMSRRSFIGAEFSNANLEGTNFSNAHLAGANFSHANLHNANFSGAEMSGCDLKGADISGARFDRAHISGCSGVTAQQLDQTQLRTWLTQCGGCDFSHADFHGMDLRNIHASGMDFAGANFNGADLSGA